MINPVIVQGIGLIALLTNLSIFQINTRKNMLILGLATCLLWSTHFYLLGAMTGSIINLIAAARFTVYYKTKPSKQNYWILWLFIGVTALATVLTWEGMISILPFIGMVSMVIAFWQKTPKSIRRLALVSSPPWILYGVLVGSYPVVVAETLLLASNFIGQYRFDFKSAFLGKLVRTSK